MRLTRIIYHSMVVPAATVDMRQLLATSHKNNKKDRLTGFLFFNKNYFIQVLEGGRDRVSARYHTIVKDPRHNNITLISCADVHERTFPTWLMGVHEGMDAETREIFLRYFATDEVDPRSISAEGLLEVMLQLSLVVLTKMSSEK